ncbi:hypothetical protein CCMA1212_007402 [Trichoderma ghanense]|uniref:Uncharacterized protein n=1 Tax=Trichoderma ghanense TaxID=65468 RepID=A0ABY2GYT0_9HYPO
MTLSGGATAAMGQSATERPSSAIGVAFEGLRAHLWGSLESLERCLAEWLRLVVRFMLAAGSEPSDQ